MIDGERVLALVPARGGSRGIPGKNLVRIGGVSLVGWAARAALGSAFADHAVLTTDDARIADEGRLHGLDVPFLRPPELARDDTPGMAPVLHALDRLEQEGRRYGWVIVLQPTSPLRTSEDVDDTVRCCLDRRAPACVSVVRVEKSPWWMYRTGPGGALSPLLPADSRPVRRQDAPEVVTLNGAVYVARVPWLREHGTFVAADTVGHVMPRERSVDVDEPVDIIVAETLLAAGDG